MDEFKKDLLELAYWKKCFKDAGNRVMWRECIKVEKVAKRVDKEYAQNIVRHALEVIHEHFRRF
jgi:hypothetical protein